jgi:cation-transporting ATPase E
MQGGSAAARGVADLVLLDDSFAAVPRAFAEGQRILNGLRDCLALYLTRLAYTTLLIAAVGLALGDFPFTPKNTSLISFLTIGAPTFALVAWAPPSARPRRGLIRSLAGFAAPAALLLTVLGLGVYAAFSWWGGAAAGRGAPPDTLAEARSALTTALVLGNVALLPLLPPHGAPAGRGGRPGGRRPALLALAMLALYGVVLAVPRARSFFELAPLGLAEVAAIGGAVALWLALLLWVRRGRLLERFLGVDPR